MGTGIDWAQTGHGHGHGLGTGTSKTGHGLGTVTDGTGHGLGTKLSTDWTRTRTITTRANARASWARAGHELGTNGLGMGGLCPNITGTQK